MKQPPSYIRLFESGELKDRAGALWQAMESCRICPWNCGVNRHQGEKGRCDTGVQPWVSSTGPHFGEERPLVGIHGSGTIFFTSCNLSCLFCQNYDISHLRAGREVTIDDLAAMMLSLQQLGCHNINFVTPTHQVAQIVAALLAAVEAGLILPLVYNCGGYESEETLRLLDGIFDIFMPDCKYGDNQTAQALSGPSDYWDAVRPALREMHRQVGDLKTDDRGIAWRGLLVRHLVLPGGRAGTKQVMEFIAREISPETYVNLMDQYHPCHRAFDLPPLDRRPSRAEFDQALQLTRAAGVHRLD